MRAHIMMLAVAVGVGGGCAESDPPVAFNIFADLGEPLPSATGEQLATFERGRAVGLGRMKPSEGFGPHFNVSFCLACHEKPAFGGSGARYRDFLLVGQRLEDGSFVGTSINGVQPQYTVAEGGRFPTDPDTNVAATRNPIPFFGVGLLAEIPDEEILSRADPDDSDGDGISGRANFQRGFVSRFGRKAQSVSIESFIRGPLFNHLGITTNPLPDERRARLPVPGADRDVLFRAADVGSSQHPQVGAPDEPTEDDDGVPDPELGENALFDLISFSMLLAAPRPDEPTPESEAGRALFDDIGCTGCHVPALEGPRGKIPAYTDLLIHDMGEDLADGIPMGEATGSEFRTAPLWGVVATGPYLHDGRADTMEEAILWHGGEAQAAREAYEALSEADRELILAFLTSLGGADQVTDGLLPSDAPLHPVGDYGGPRTELSGEERELFERGRAVFDRDPGRSEGLGPLFNGDSCRACHFDPVIGGAGPKDVSVIRHAIIDEDSGTFTAPSIGTIAHKQSIALDERAPIDPEANYFEARQTPPVFGLGLVDEIPREDILANADPNDEDGDGISGRPNILEDGRLGRTGWKADVPSLAEFARDGLTNEMGVTVPDQEGLTFGAAEDDDGVADPEISREDVEALIFYMEQLAPPPRTRRNEAREDAGEAVFSEIGCADCHIPEMQTADGTPVRAYSDFLLHDVQPPYRHGVESRDASMREFRTAPLWGLAKTAPYMHDGSAATVEEAIRSHHAEAEAAREAYLALPQEEREALAAFLRSL